MRKSMLIMAIFSLSACNKAVETSSKVSDSDVSNQIRVASFESVCYDGTAKEYDVTVNYRATKPGDSQVVSYSVPIGSTYIVVSDTVVAGDGRFSNLTLSTVKNGVDYGYIGEIAAEDFRHPGTQQQIGYSAKGGVNGHCLPVSQ